MPYKNKIAIECPDCGAVRMQMPNYLKHHRSARCHPCATKAYGKTIDKGYVSHPLYQRWQGMKARCTYEKHKDWKHYGGRGITVCDEWQDFGAFRDWAGEDWHGLTLDRIDNDKGYSPDNCKWSTPSEQCVNRRPWTKSGEAPAPDPCHRLI